jgi:hypothetical protein
MEGYIKNLHFDSGLEKFLKIKTSANKADFTKSYIILQNKTLARTG